MSSLAQQLKTISDKTASVALDRKSRSKIHARSLLFDPKTASTQDYDYIYQIGLEGLDELSEIDSRFNKFRQTLFSETSVSLDRNVQTKETLTQLDRNIEAFLTLAGPYYLLTPTIKAIEWLVRRFHINIHNAEFLLISSLPYHSQPVFVKILNVIPKNQFPKIFEWVVGYKDLLKAPPSSSVLKAFHNDFEIFKLYTMFLVEQLKNHTVYKQQLLFYLSNTVQLLASLSKKLDTLNELYLPVVLEVVGVMLLPSQSEKSKTSRDVQIDIKLTAYSIIAVLASLIPISSDLIRSFTESILQDPKSFEAPSRRQTLIVLSQLWRFYQGDFSEKEAVAQCFKALPSSALAKEENLIKELISDNYKVQKFLTHYFFATFPNPESYKIFQFLDLNSEVFFNEVTKQIIDESNTVEEANRVIIINIAESLLKQNHDLFVENLVANKITIDALEMRLMTTLGSNSAVRDSDDLEFDAGEEDNNDEEDEDLVNAASSEVDLGSLQSTTKTFFNTNSDDEFSSLSKALISLLKNANVKIQKSLMIKFTKTVFTSPEAGLSFLIRVAFTPSIPISIRLSAIRCTKSKLLEAASTASSPLDLYLLIPIFLLGSYDSSKAVRSGFVQLLRVVKEQTNAIHAGKKKVKSTLFMEEQIYDTTEAAKRAIIPPSDASYFCDLLFDDDILDDVVIDRSRLNKKFGQLILKTFVINQWSLNFLPVVLKWKAWNIVSVENEKGTDDRFFFSESDLSEYSKKRSTWLEQANIAKIDFFDDVERAIVGLVGGASTNESKTTDEVDWIIQALQSQFANLQISVNKRLLDVFSSFASVEHRIKIANKFIDILVNEDNTEIDAMESLQSFKLDHDLFINILSNVQIGSQIPEQGIAKRRRRSSNSTKQAMAKDDINNLASIHLKKLTVILDLLESNLRNASNGTEIARPNLLQALFKILTDLDYLGNDGNLPVLYAQETLASCMLLSIIKMKNSEKQYKFDSNSIRADLIVNSIRSSQSPQVQNRLLLVIAELATLTPEIILHSVMPIFTFMGAHTVRQDDEFSSSALQQTIAKVIPALAANGSSSINNEIEFLLTSFVTAFQHIPRHRRVKLFTSLIRTLGCDKSLHVLLFLMGQQYVNNLNKNKVSECTVILEFTTSFLKSFSAIEQLEGITKFVELWDMIPITELEQNSEEYNKLSTRSIFGASILSLTNASLVTLKSELLKYLSSVVATEASYYDSTSLKTKISVVLLDSTFGEEEKKSILGAFRGVTSYLLSSLDAFTNVSKTPEIAVELYDLLANFLNLLPINYFVDSIVDSLDVEKLSDTLSIKVARNFVILAGAKFETELSTTNIDESVESSVLEKLLPVLLNGIKKNVDTELEQAYLDTFSIIVNKFGTSTKELVNAKNSRTLIEALNTITSENCLLSEQPETIISSINAITSVVNVLGVKTIGLFPKIVPPSLRIWSTTIDSEDEDSARLIQASIILLLSCLIKRIPAFMTSSLDSIFITILSSDFVENNIRSNVLGLVVEHMDTSQVLKSLCNIWYNKKFYQNGNTGNIGLYLNTVQLTIDKIDKKSAAAQSTTFIKWLIQAFEFRHYSEEADTKFDNNTIHRLESSFHSCGISYVMKLNDKKFRPLFATLVRWAIQGEGSNFSENTEISRLVAFFKFFNKMQEQLKSIITSYFSYLLDPVASILKRFASNEIQDINLRRILLNSLTSSFKYDQDDYWSQQGRFDSICVPLLEQLTNIEDGIGKYLVKAITAFIHNVASEEYNETLVHGLIKYISNEKGTNSSNTKIWTIRALKSIFQKMGEQWLTYLPTLIPYIAELLEDDDEAVEMEVRSGLVRVIENVLGEPLDRYLD
ncbi:component of small subunit processosome [Scheffersomyces xylosifermentans]|uniref:component of small subunit processosome n=1 Tax=Scheffersomyces xylosifermentans TaxID=1304137 RepID=UPI00315D85B8